VGLASLIPGESPGVFRLRGDLDISNVEAIGRQLEDALRENEDLTLDLEGLTFMDSQGLQMLIKLGKQALEQRKSVRVANAPGQVRRLFDLAVPSGIPGVEITDLGNT